MQSVLQKSGHAELAILALAVLLFAFLFFAGPAFAGADTTFNTALTKFTDFLEGSGGKIITVLSLAGGIVALASGRHRHSDRHLDRDRDDLNRSEAWRGVAAPPGHKEGVVQWPQTSTSFQLIWTIPS